MNVAPVCRVVCAVSLGVGPCPRTQVQLAWVVLRSQCTWGAVQFPQHSMHGNAEHGSVHGKGRFAASLPQLPEDAPPQGLVHAPLTRVLAAAGQQVAASPSHCLDSISEASWVSDTTSLSFSPRRASYASGSPTFRRGSLLPRAGVPRRLSVASVSEGAQASGAAPPGPYRPTPKELQRKFSAVPRKVLLDLDRAVRKRTDSVLQQRIKPQHNAAFRAAGRDSPGHGVAAGGGEAVVAMRKGEAFASAVQRQVHDQRRQQAEAEAVEAAASLGSTAGHSTLKNGAPSTSGTPSDSKHSHDATTANLSDWRKRLAEGGEAKAGRFGSRMLAALRGGSGGAPPPMTQAHFQATLRRDPASVTALGPPDSLRLLGEVLGVNTHVAAGRRAKAKVLQRAREGVDSMWRAYKDQCDREHIASVAHWRRAYGLAMTHDQRMALEMFRGDDERKQQHAAERAARRREWAAVVGDDPA